MLNIDESSWNRAVAWSKVCLYKSLHILWLLNSNGWYTPWIMKKVTPHERHGVPITGNSTVGPTVSFGVRKKKQTNLKALCYWSFLTGPVTWKMFPCHDVTWSKSFVVRCFGVVTSLVFMWFVWLNHPYRPGPLFTKTLQWRHNERNSVSNHRRLDCLLNRLFRCRSKKTSKLRVTGLCEGNSPVTGGFPTQRASDAKTVSIA